MKKKCISIIIIVIVWINTIPDENEIGICNWSQNYKFEPFSSLLFPIYYIIIKISINK